MTPHIARRHIPHAKPANQTRQAAGPSPAKSQTLVFHVVFSPFELAQTNNARNPNSPYSLGGELLFHDQLFSSGQHVGGAATGCIRGTLTL